MATLTNWYLLLALLAMTVVFLFTVQEVILYKWHVRNVEQHQFVHLLQFRPEPKVIYLAEAEMREFLRSKPH